MCISPDVKVKTTDQWSNFKSKSPNNATSSVILYPELY